MFVLRLYKHTRVCVYLCGLNNGDRRNCINEQLHKPNKATQTKDIDDISVDLLYIYLYILQMLEVKCGQVLMVSVGRAQIRIRSGSGYVRLDQDTFAQQKNPRSGYVRTTEKSQISIRSRDRKILDQDTLAGYVRATQKSTSGIFF